ncbi:uncharacterized protein AMSG_04866 [Thecamonas trahens ATCC 50062]|uniref:Uncharacterized protein n=1 Tax=Thecamonas trahens ATCC 50062 TaxID=461836 RepID=A0A0L0DAU4_THETB|nr:hypothetical protein AMSG_04866 [Thecamonas trahens ATCC 50062]KNC48418.1 hypothetical protein AMSG_04866 [Thecamonas trahens ATCC 50062]|eukprot:XP_013758535.1 hypothetical protein AMSG_04866 [Thecamonas trahens ATCC 50062]
MQVQQVESREDGERANGVPGGEQEYRVYTRRWAMLALFCMLGLMCSLLQMTYAAVQDISRLYYGVSTTEINLMATSYMLAFPPFTLAAAYVLHVSSLHVCLSIGMAFMAAGTWLRWIGATPNGFIWAITGQSLTAIGQPFIVSTMTMFSASWFEPERRTLATTFASFTNVLGSGVAFGMNPAIVKTGSQLKDLTFGQAVFTSALALATFIFFRSRPPTPPSPAADAADSGKAVTKAAALEAAPLLGEQATQPRATPGYKSLLTNVNFLIILLLFGLGFGAFQSYLTVLNQILLPEGFTTEEAGNVGVCVIGAGLFGAFAAGAVLDATHAFRPIIIAALTGLLGSQWWLFLRLSHMSLAVEVTFPVPESASNGLMYMIGTGSAFVQVLALDALQDPHPPRKMTNSLWFLVIEWTVLYLLSFFIRPNYLRREHELAQANAALAAPVGSGTSPAPAVAAATPDPPTGPSLATAVAVNT